MTELLTFPFLIVTGVANNAKQGSINGGNTSWKWDIPIEIITIAASLTIVGGTRQPVRGVSYVQFKNADNNAFPPFANLGITSVAGGDITPQTADSLFYLETGVQYWFPVKQPVYGLKLNRINWETNVITAASGNQIGGNIYLSFQRLRRAL